MKFTIKVEKPQKEGYCLWANTFEGMLLQVKFILVDDTQDKNCISIECDFDDKEETYLMTHIYNWDFDKYEEILRKIYKKLNLI